MKNEDFESKLARQPMRQIPLDWRREILQTAAASAPTSNTPPIPASWWRQWLWPCPQAWAGVAAVWVLIFALNLASTSAPREPKHVVLARAEYRELQRQHDLLARLLAPPEPPETAEPPKSPTHAQIIRRENVQFT